MNENETVVSKKSLTLLLLLSGAALLVAIGAFVFASQPRELSLKEAAGGCCAFYAEKAEPDQSVLSLKPGSQPEHLNAPADAAQLPDEKQPLNVDSKKIRLGKYDDALNCVSAPKCGG